jgi:hypothetical protein
MMNKFYSFGADLEFVKKLNTIMLVNSKSMRRFAFLVAAGVSSAGLVSCGGESAEESKPGKNADVVKSTGEYATNFSVDGVQFSIPSPIQTAMLIKNSGAAFNPELVNPTDNNAKYTSNFQKALNLGVYGADLAYITINQNPDKAMTYFATVSTLSEDLNVSGAFSSSIINRFRDNIENSDSLLVLVGEAYRAGNSYLLTEKRVEIIALILTGGWIETMHIATSLVNKSTNQQIIDRIGEQKSSLKGLIALLKRRSSDAALHDPMDNLVAKLTELQAEFDKIKFTYQYADPKTMPDQKLTELNSKTEVSIDQETLSKIVSLIGSIRSDIIN